MFEREFRAFALLWLLVNAISGSPRFQSWDQQARRFRHASCPSCRRERPDALVSWDKPPRRGSYPDFEPEIDPWQVGQLYRPNFYPPLCNNPFDDPYNSPCNGAIGGRGSPGFIRAEGASRRENLFTIGRDLDFNVAPAQATPVPSLSGFVPPVQPQTPFSRVPVKTSYRRPGFYDLIRGQSNLVAEDEYVDFVLPPNDRWYDEPKRYSGPYKEYNREFRPSYKADRYLDDSFEQSNPMMDSELRLRGQIAYGTGPGSLQMQERGEVLRPRKNQLEHVRFVDPPGVKYNRYGPCSLSSGQNVVRSLQNFGKGVMGVINGNKWNWLEGQKRQLTGGRGVIKNEENGNVRVVVETNGSNGNGGHFELGQKLGESVGQRNGQDEGKASDGSSIVEVSQSQLVSIERNSQPAVAEATTPPQPVIMG